MKLICIKNTSDALQRIRHPAFIQAPVVSAVPGGHVIASSASIEVAPDQSVKVPSVIFDMVARRLLGSDGKPAFLRIEDSEFNKLALKAPALKGTQWAWGLLPGVVDDCDQPTTEGSIFCEAHAERMTMIMTDPGPVPVEEPVEDVPPQEASLEPGPGEALADVTIAEGQDVEQGEQPAINPCACRKCGKICKTPLGRGAHEAHCDGTPKQAA